MLPLRSFAALLLTVIAVVVIIIFSRHILVLPKVQLIQEDAGQARSWRCRRHCCRRHRCGCCRGDGVGGGSGGSPCFCLGRPLLRCRSCCRRCCAGQWDGVSRFPPSGHAGQQLLHIQALLSCKRPEVAGGRRGCASGRCGCCCRRRRCWLCRSWTSSGHRRPPGRRLPLRILGLLPGLPLPCIQHTYAHLSANSSLPSSGQFPSADPSQTAPISSGQRPAARSRAKECSWEARISASCGAGGLKK